MQREADSDRRKMAEMAFGGVPVYGSSTTAAHAVAEQQAAALAHHLGQVSLESSPVLSAKTPKFTRKYSLRELEIQQTIGELRTRRLGSLVIRRDLGCDLDVLACMRAYRVPCVRAFVRLRGWVCVRVVLGTEPAHHPLL